MLRSMTGFGRGRSCDEGREFEVEIKAVNHRYSDIFIKMPRQVSFLEDKVRELVAKTLSRGKADVFITFNDYSADSKNVLIDEPLARAYIRSMEQLRDQYGLRDDITVSLISRFPDVLKVEKSEDDEELIWLLLKTAVEEALQSLVKMRESEGLKLKTNLMERTACIQALLRDISQRAPDVVTEYRQKLEARIKELLDQQPVDEGRLAMEVATFADRCSIHEEIIRLGSHIAQLDDTLCMEVPVGRKMDFLIQEMNREINTIGSKANDLAIARIVVELKSELEKIREQIQNIE